MDLILDGAAQDVDTSNCANLAELVAAAERSETDVQGGGEASLVVAIEVDGQALSPEELSLLESHSLEGIERVSIDRRPARAVALSVLTQGAEYTERIATAILDAVEKFRAGRSDLGSGVLADVTDSLSVLTGITMSVSAVLSAESESLVVLQGEILPWLEELVEAQAETDPIRIGDLLEYEIKPRVEEWGAVMRAMGGAASNTTSAASAEVSN